MKTSQPIWFCGTPQEWDVLAQEKNRSELEDKVKVLKYEAKEGYDVDDNGILGHGIVNIALGSLGYAGHLMVAGEGVWSSLAFGALSGIGILVVSSAVLGSIPTVLAGLPTTLGYDLFLKAKAKLKLRKTEKELSKIQEPMGSLSGNSERLAAMSLIIEKSIDSIDSSERDFAKALSTSLKAEAERRQRLESMNKIIANEIIKHSEALGAEPIRNTQRALWDSMNDVERVSLLNQKLSKLGQIGEVGVSMCLEIEESLKNPKTSTEVIRVARNIINESLPSILDTFIALSENEKAEMTSRGVNAEERLIETISAMNRRWSKAVVEAANIGALSAFEMEVAVEERKLDAVPSGTRKLK